MNVGRSPLASLLVSTLLGAGLGAPVAYAQHGDVAAPEARPTLRARAGVAAIGERWDAAAFAETVRLYTDVHRDVEWPGIREPESIRYGPDAQQTFTLFRPEQGFSEPGFVLLFVHGNGLGHSDAVAEGSEGLIYSHIGKLAAHFGGIGLTVNYRTRERASWLAGAEDLRIVLDWVREHIADYGGDPDTVVLIANSDGATRAASYLFSEALQPATGPGVAAAVLSSGSFGELAPHVWSLVAGYDGERVPLALWSAEYDPAAVETGIADLYAQLCRKYADCPTLVQLAGHNHVSHVMSLGTRDTAAQEAFIRFYHTVR